MTSANSSREDLDNLEADAKNERRRSTTVIMTDYVSMPDVQSTIRRAGSVRRRLSKQNATIEEPISPRVNETSAKSETDEEPGARQKLHREDAVVGDDDTRLRPLHPTPKHQWCTSQSLSRESSATDYSDRSGTDIRSFIQRTLHKSAEDRKQLLAFEEQLRRLINDETNQSMKFELPSSYHRMLLHRCAAWYGLDHNITNKQTEIVVNKSDKTKIPEETFRSFITGDDFFEPKFGPKRKTIVPRRSIKHGDSCHEENLGSPIGDALIMRRAQSFDVSPISAPHPNPSMMCMGMSQLSLQAHPVPPTIPAWNASHQRSFECGNPHHHNNSAYVYTTRPAQAVMRKAESFGGMSRGGCLEIPITSPSLLVHHHNAPGYHVNFYDEVPSPPQPYFQDVTICSPSTVYYEYPSPNQSQCVTYVQHSPIRHIHQIPRVQSQVYYPPTFQYIQPEVIIDPVLAQPFPPVGHFSPNDENESRSFGSFCSTQQAENANRFIKTSIDGGYGSMNQEVESNRESDTNSVQEDVEIESKSSWYFLPRGFFKPYFQKIQYFYATSIHVSNYALLVDIQRIIFLD